MVEISVVIPCLNEEKTVGRCIEKALQALKKYNLQGEVIVADNGSYDNSQSIAIASGAQLIQASEKGYGAALMSGVAHAHGEFVIMGDADDSYDFSQIFLFIEKLREGYDLVVGCRFPKGGGKIMPGAMPWKHRWIGNPILTTIGKLFFHSPLSDFHCGLRAFRKSAYDQMDLRTTGMEFASEMIIKASLLQMKVTEIPITLYKDGRGRPSHLRSWRDGWRHLRFMLLFSPRWLFFIPGIILTAIGGLFTSVLLKGPIYIGHIGFDTNTLLVGCMLILVGIQLVMFAMFTKIFATLEGFLPQDYKMVLITKFMKLEVGIIAGLLFIILGISLLIYGVIYWKNRSFGTLSYQDSLRIVIPATTTIVLGLQIIFSSFFIGVLSLKRK